MYIYRGTADPNVHNDPLCNAIGTLCMREKKSFHCSFAKYTFFESPEIPPHSSIKTFFAKYAVCSKIDIMSAVFSICTFDLRNFKVHGNAPTEVNVCLASFSYLSRSPVANQHMIYLLNCIDSGRFCFARLSQGFTPCCIPALSMRR